MTLRDRALAVLRLLTRRTPRQLTKGFPPNAAELFSFRKANGCAD